MMTTMVEMLFCLFPLLSFSLGCVFVNETNDIVDLANCDGGTLLGVFDDDDDDDDDDRCAAGRFGSPSQYCGPLVL